MALSTRDADAFELAKRRRFGGTYLVELALEMQTRRLTLQIYGGLDGRDTVLARLTFYGVAGYALASGEAEAFPESARIESLKLSYEDEADEGHVDLRGEQGWTMSFAFDGMAYQQAPALLSSFEDE